jgi:hypothetical protein
MRMLARLVEASLKCRECAYTHNAAQPILAYLGEHAPRSEPQPSAVTTPASAPGRTGDSGGARAAHEHSTALSDALGVLAWLAQFGVMVRSEVLGRDGVTSEEVERLVSFLRVPQCSAAAAKLMCALVDDEQARAKAVLGGLVPQLLELLTHSAGATQVFAMHTPIRTPAHARAHTHTHTRARARRSSPPTRSPRSESSPTTA